MKCAGMPLAVAMILSGLTIWMAGCGTPSPKPLTPQAFWPSQGLTSDLPTQSTTRTNAPVDPPKAGTVADDRISTAQTIVPSANPPASQPAVGLSTGKYLTIGSVVAEVNGSPIYANRVIQELNKALQAQARELDLDRFQIAATALIRDKIRNLIRDELEFATAQRLLEMQDRSLADSLTTQWRQKQITDAGGSLEVARRTAQADGYDFDDLVKQRNRWYMTWVYYQKKVTPRIQISADDMRKYYRRNVAGEFTDQDQAQFRLIKIDPSQVGDESKAREFAEQLRKRAAAGEDFAELAANPALNHDKRLLKSRGDEGWIERGAYRMEKIEKAVWSVKPGQITPVIQEGPAFYIAKLEAQKLGRVRGFDEATVQNEIHNKLHAQQFRTMREQIQSNLIADAIIRGDPDREPAMMQPAIEMALQKYAIWSAGKGR